MPINHFSFEYASRPITMDGRRRALRAECRALIEMQC